MKDVEIFRDSNQLFLNNNLEMLLVSEDIKVINFAKQIVKSLRKQVLYFKKDDLLTALELDMISAGNAYFALLNVFIATGLQEPLLPSGYFASNEGSNDYVLNYMKALDSALIEKLVYFLYPSSQAKEIWSNRLPLISRL